MSLEEEKRFDQRERERSHESREGEIDEELKSAVAMERADLLVKEVKSNKQQMQNILMHMQHVKQAIKDLRAQLELEDDDNPSSLRHDEERVAELQTKIAEYKDEIVKMKDDLIVEQMHIFEDRGIVGEEVRRQAEEMVERMIKSF